MNKNKKTHLLSTGRGFIGYYSEPLRCATHEARALLHLGRDRAEDLSELSEEQHPVQDLRREEQIYQRLRIRAGLTE